MKWKLRLAEKVEPGGVIPEESVRQLVSAVASADETARRWGAGGPPAFATAVVRTAPNRLDVLRTVRDETGVRLCTLPGEAEAEPTFLGARRWMGRRAGSLVLFDIGGGSLEMALGRGRLPDFAASLPLGAGRLTREFPGGQDPPSGEDLRALRRRVRHQLRDRGRTAQVGRAPHGGGDLADLPAAGPALRGPTRPPGRLRGAAAVPGRSPHLSAPARRPVGGRAGDAPRRLRAVGPAEFGRSGGRAHGDEADRHRDAHHLPVGHPRRSAAAVCRGRRIVVGRDHPGAGRSGAREADAAADRDAGGLRRRRLCGRAAPDPGGVTAMADKGRTDKIKGKAKEIVGKATSDREQELEGKLEQARGEAKKIRGEAQERASKAARSDKRDRG
ncbi:hypothetical protein GCM10023084_63580 [Streptomyces lacrimifluminis]|uniref:Ppx/GppA phosphatase N-terminal domain-containing protein n=2 Tax=Streptomyces lacrimifluminis TaxID=1500077 RepID=A0A917LD30_9ACTN|nr:hypothetical protein GCM10012282_63230 [Streptomyces lacrimifluminis]